MDFQRTASVLITALTLTVTAAAQRTYEGCGLHGIGQRIGANAQVFGRGLVEAPREAIRPRNLKWELPVIAGTVLLIEKADTHAADSIQSKPLVKAAGRASNIGLGVELASGTIGFFKGCHGNESRLREASFTALAATAEAGLVDLGLKLAFNRHFPNGVGVASPGNFWTGGRSFPSGHSATSFAFASAMAHSYPEKRWLKWSLYGIATGVSLLRIPAKHHFPSDVVIGGAIGYVIGAYAADHAPY